MWSELFCYLGIEPRSWHQLSKLYNLNTWRIPHTYNSFLIYHFLESAKKFSQVFLHDMCNFLSFASLRAFKHLYKKNTIALV